VGVNIAKAFGAALFVGCLVLVFHSTREPTAAENNLAQTAMDKPTDPIGTVESTEVQSKNSNRVGIKTENSTASSIRREEAAHQARIVVMCARYREDMREADVLLQQPVDGANDLQLKWRDESLAAINDRLITSAPTCESHTNSEKDIYPTLLQAARLGDLDAAVCYVEANFPLDADQLARMGLEDYRKTALALVDAGLQRGDWRFVELMRMAAEHGGPPHRGRDAHSWFRRLIQPSPQIAYVYARIEQLGAKGQFADEIGNLVNSYRDQLTDEALKIQDQWASSQYKYLFAHSPALENFPKLCGY
jgi:hypothetical protein